MQEVLEFEGFEVVTAANGRQGLEALERPPRPAVILLDLMMPEMNGAEFLSVMRAHRVHGNTPVVVVTAFADRADGLRADAVIEKPVNLEALFRTIRSFAQREPA